MSLDIQIPRLSINPKLYSTDQHKLSRRPPQQKIRKLNNHNKMGLNIPNPRNMHVPRPQELREAFHSSPTSGYLLFGWVLSGVLAIIIPVSKWVAERNDYYNYAGKYNQYEQQQRQYEEQQNGNYNMYGSLCKWYDFKCRISMGRYQQQYGNNGEQDNEQQAMRQYLPNWFFFFGGQMEDDERQREEMGLSENNGSMIFVYTCTLLMFIGLSIYGFTAMYKGKDWGGIIAALLIMGQFLLMNLLTTVQGTVETDNRFFEDSTYGWYGQWSVLVAYTDFWLMLHCFIFAGLLGLLKCLDKKAAQDVKDESAILEMGYRNEDEEAYQADPVDQQRAWTAEAENRHALE